MSQTSRIYRSNELLPKSIWSQDISLPPDPQDWEELDPHDLHSPHLYVNRELSWLEFNQRVLDQAYDPRHPLLERLKFLAIVSTNLDEFVMIRVATLLKKLRGDAPSRSPDGLSTEQQLWAVRKRVEQMQRDKQLCWEKELRKELIPHHILFLDPQDYSEAVRQHLETYFWREIYPVLTPLAFDPGHPFPFISSLSLNLAVVVTYNEELNFARVKIPTQLPRFVRLPASLTDNPNGVTFAFLEDIVKQNLHYLFPNIPIEECYLFRIIRDTDLVIQEDEADDLLETVDAGLRQIRYGSVTLLQVEQAMPQMLLDMLAENCGATSGIITRTSHRMNYADWMSLINLPFPDLRDPSFSPPVLFHSEHSESIFERIRVQDYLVHHPFEAFTSVENFLDAAVKDPKVIGIKMTLYRVGSNSRVVQKLIEAAQNDKQIAVLVELKARFDEKNNIVWAKKLESVGAHVVYGLLNLKTHCKLCMVIRQEPDGVRRYVHIGTGNYNPASSKIYTDLGLFTSNEKIAQDASDVFNLLTGYSRKHDYHHLLVAPVTLRKQLSQMLEREAEHAKAGRPAQIILKVNSIADPEIIRALYRTSQAGVKIDLIVRGVCCLRPGIPNISETIRVRSIVGRFLEHSRIFYFRNGGDEQIYIGSADLMERNLDRRIEVLTPVLQENLRKHLRESVLDTLLADNQQSFDLHTSGAYRRIDLPEPHPVNNAQLQLLERYAHRDHIDL
jgi:polyphosphate kinase